MSINVINIKSNNIDSLEKIVSNQSIQIDNLTDLFSDNNKRSYDQTTRQNVSISFDEVTNIYRFEIQKPENDIFMYQVWKQNNNALNSQRKYKYKKLRDWISYFFKRQKNFTPTTLIQINNKFYPTIMIDSGIENNYCVFYFLSKQITHPQDIIVEQIPTNGNYNNVRFDIDDNSLGPSTQLIGTWLGRAYYSYSDINNYITINPDGTIIIKGSSNLNSGISIDGTYTDVIYDDAEDFCFNGIQGTILSNSLNQLNIDVGNISAMYNKISTPAILYGKYNSVNGGIIIFNDDNSVSINGVTGSIFEVLLSTDSSGNITGNITQIFIKYPSGINYYNYFKDQNSAILTDQNTNEQFIYINIGFSETTLPTIVELF